MCVFFSFELFKKKYMRNRARPEYSFSFATNPYYGSMGENGVHQSTATVFSNATTAISDK